LQAGLRDTIQRLRTLGVARVVLIGTVPVWRVAQPRLILGEWRRSGELPARMAEGLLPGLSALDESFAALARNNGADYISALALLCNELGCETTVYVDGTAHPMAPDQGHLSAAGSRLLARRMLGALRAKAP
jgi:lysophospholipase L1-like esterase